MAGVWKISGSTINLEFAAARERSPLCLFPPLFHRRGESRDPPSPRHEQFEWCVPAFVGTTVYGGSNGNRPRIICRTALRRSAHGAFDDQRLAPQRLSLPRLGRDAYLLRGFPRLEAGQRVRDR